jgi:hypothetical protein
MAEQSTKKTDNTMAEQSTKKTDNTMAEQSTKRQTTQWLNKVQKDRQHNG